MRALATLCVCGSSLLFLSTAPRPEIMEFQSLSPIIVVDTIEPCVPFWSALGFTAIAEVPHGDALGFIMLQRDNATVMYQSFASAEADIPGVVQRPLRSTTALYLRIKGFEEVLGKLGAAPVVVPERTTFYGAREIFVTAPCGTTVGFAEMSDQE